MDVSSLINEVLNMVGESQRYNRDRQTQGTYRGIHWITGAQLDEERKKRDEEEKAARQQEYAMQTQAAGSEKALALERLKNIGAADVQGLHNTGSLAVEREKSAGGLARQRLMNLGEIEKQGLVNEGSLAGKNIEAGYHRFAAEQGLRSNELHSAATIEASKNARAAKENAATIGAVIKGWAEGNPSAESLTSLLTAYREGSGKGGTTPLSAPGTPAAETAFENARSLARKSLGASSIVTPTRVDARRFMTPDTDTGAPAPAVATLANTGELPENLADKMRRRKLWFGEPVAPIQPTIRSKTNWRNANTW